MTCRVFDLARSLLALLLTLLISSCAHVSARTRASRVMLGTGVAAVVVGTLVATGCVDSSGDGGCTGSPDRASVGGGVATLVVGAVLIGSGLWMRPAGQHVFGPPPPPAPPSPDPLVPPMRGY